MLLLLLQRYIAQYKRKNIFFEEVMLHVFNVFIFSAKLAIKVLKSVGNFISIKVLHTCELRNTLFSSLCCYWHCIVEGVSILGWIGVDFWGQFHSLLLRNIFSEKNILFHYTVRNVVNQKKKKTSVISTSNPLRKNSVHFHKMLACLRLCLLGKDTESSSFKDMICKQSTAMHTKQQKRQIF